MDTNYFDLMKTRFTSGRNFFGNFSDSVEQLVINQTLAAELGIKKLETLSTVNFLGKKCAIIGIVEDMNFYGFEDKIGPMVFTTAKHTLTPFILVRINSQKISTTIRSIESFWTKVEPGFPLNYQFLNQSFQQLFSSYESLIKIFTLLTACALLIAFIGLFGLTALITRQRSKEIAIRKIMGASVTQILKLMNGNFVKLSILANLIAWPAAHYLSHRWLDNFAFRIALPISPFLIAVALSLALTIITVCIQTFKFATGSQVELLHDE
ncbi:MAG TPA: FtsX-like permease family protein [Puia sp.]|nr:FtsX-like permease family protein [Puia sp.]